MIYLDFGGVEAESFEVDVARGLRYRQKRISPKYFYDPRGSELFEAICKQPEYYPTRTETLILHQNIGEITERVRNDCGGNPHPVLIEFGSGASLKTQILLDHLKFEAYVPLDISKSFLLKTAQELVERYPEITILPAFGDFTKRIEFPPFVLKNTDTRIAFLPGSTLGNFDPLEGIKILRSIRSVLESEENGYLLIGMDLAKDPSVLEAAYNDAAGVTAAFNKNLIARLRKEARADVDPELFEHRAFFNEKLSRIEMHLVARQCVSFKIGDEEFRIEAGESIHTENSYKYRPSTFETICRDSGFETLHFWTDPKGWFGVFLLKTSRISLESKQRFG